MSVELMRRMRAIRRLASTYPSDGMAERLEKIRLLANGELGPEAVRRPADPDFFDRIERARASRSPRTAADKREEALRRKEQKDLEAKREEGERLRRKARGGRNRLEAGGEDRSEEGSE